MTTTHFKNLVMGQVFRTQTSTPIPSKYYIGLSSTTPNASGGNVGEPSTSGTGYARVPLTLGAPINGVITNTSDIRFNESQTDWFPTSKPATYYVIYDAQSGGNLLMYGALTKSRVIESNTITTILTASLQLKLLD